MAGGLNQRQQSWNRACDCFATAKIFERRARSYRFWIDSLTYLGIGVPAIFGAMIAAWGPTVLDNPLPASIVAVLGVVQVGTSVAAVIRKWPDEYSYSNQSAAINFQLADEFQQFASTPSDDSSANSDQFQKLVVRDQFQTQLDSQKHVTDKEKCWGHRHALKQFNRKCAKCGEVPNSMKPTVKCIVCGDF